MPIPFRDADEIEELGYASYLRLLPDGEGTGWRGALFTINARGEPIEFTYNRIDTPNTFLWRPDDVRQFAARKLMTSLFKLCPKPPTLVACLAEEVGSELFGRDIHVDTVVCRIAPAIVPVSHWASEAPETLDIAEPLNLFWTPAKPSDDSPERRLLNELTARGLALEPFDRALKGLSEVYKTTAPEDT